MSATSAATDDPSLAAETIELTKVYGQAEAEVRAVDGITLSVPSGSYTAVMGPSGSGKSTLLHCLAGLDRPTSGTVRIGGTDLATLKDKALTELRREQVGFVFQAFNLVPTLTARENIVLPLSLGRRDPDPAWFDAVITSLALGDRLGHRPAELSGGQQQRVAAARALATRPEIVFGDEPTGNLDSRSGADLLSLLQRSAQELGQTIVMVTHDATAAAYSDRVVFLADGQVVDQLLEPTAEAIFDRMKRLEAGPSGHDDEA